MRSWTSGYVADIGYTFGYYYELNPNRVKLAFLNAGLVAPAIGTACELGFGQGVSTNIHASASLCSWYGNDFNPSQASFAQELAGISGANARLFDESFEEFFNREMPEFDYIGLHGIWSWISDENRARIVDFVKRKLKVGGVLYISYNTLPGWAAFAPLRHLMTEHAEIMGSEGSGILSRIDGAIQFTDKLLATNPLYAKVNPSIAEKMTQVRSLNRHYIAHEYFNRDWKPMYFGEISRLLAGAKITYACSAHFLDYVDAINLTKEQQELLKEISDPIFKESVRDFMVNSQFRRDYWVKGARRISAIEQVEILKSQKYVLTVHRNDIALKILGALGEATLTENIYKPVLDLMADHKIRTVSQIQDSIKENALTISQLIQVLVVLCGINVMSAVQEEAVIAKAKKSTDKLNQHLMLKARGSNDIGHLASPVTGSAQILNRFEQLFTLGVLQGKKVPEELVNFLSEILKFQGERVLKDGIRVEDDLQQDAILLGHAKNFINKQLPILKALQIT